MSTSSTPTRNVQRGFSATEHFHERLTIYINDVVSDPLSSGLEGRQLVTDPISIYINDVAADPLNSGLEGRRLAYPCLDPVFRNMESEEARCRTFFSSARWPGRQIDASPRQIARAGFFYIGVSDRVKCWYCGGGLQNWERDDEPWKEHAKWYPTCEYLLQRQGFDFVHRVSSQFQHLRRPVLPPARELRNHSLPQVQSRGVVRTTSSSFQIIDPAAESRRLFERVNFELRSETAREAMAMGFEESAIRSAIRRKLETNGERFSNSQELVDAILSLSEQERAAPLNTPAPAYETVEPLIDLENISAASGARELRRLEELRLCRRCRNEPANMVFIPCGHLVCCVNCGNSLLNCLVCHAVINERIRSYIA